MKTTPNEGQLRHTKGLPNGIELWDEILVKNITKIVFETPGMTDFSIFSKVNAFASYACMLHTSFV